MAALNASVPRTLLAQRPEGISAEDFETASIRSTAPSYMSDAPSYHSQAIPNEPVPPYSPRRCSITTTSARRSNPAAQRPSRTSGPIFVPPPTGMIISSTVQTRGNDRPPGGTGNSSPSLARASEPAEATVATGLPPMPSPRSPMSGTMPNLGQFRIPTIAANPCARHYARVAQRRAQAKAAAEDTNFAVQMLLKQFEEEETRRFRPLEDPYLVGEEEAQRARQRRITHESGPSPAGLEREGRRWDWFLSQIREWDERERRNLTPAVIFNQQNKGKRQGGRLGLFGRR